MHIFSLVCVFSNETMIPSFSLSLCVDIYIYIHTHTHTHIYAFIYHMYIKHDLIWKNSGPYVGPGIRTWKGKQKVFFFFPFILLDPWEGLSIWRLKTIFNLEFFCLLFPAIHYLCPHPHAFWNFYYNDFVRNKQIGLKPSHLTINKQNPNSYSRSTVEIWIYPGSALFSQL